MPTPQLLCLLPAERAHLAPQVRAAGGVPVIDLTCGDAEVPAGAWVRARSRKGLPGDGPVILAGGGHPSPLRTRPTWLEVSGPRPLPAGFAGLVLRGPDVGGLAGDRPGLELLAELPAGIPVILDAGLGPEQAAEAAALEANGLLVSDLLLGLPELALPPRLRALVEQADPSTCHVVNGFCFRSSPMAPALRGLLGGSPFWSLAAGCLAHDDPSQRVWAVGRASLSAPRVAGRHGDLNGLLSAFAQSMASVRPSGLRPPPIADDPASLPGSVAIVGLGARLPGALSKDQYWENILEGRSAIAEVPVERWDPALYWSADRGAVDRTYCKIGGFLRGFQFNPKRFRIPPSVARLVDPVQQITLEAAADALADAGYKPLAGEEGRDFDRRRTAVILGNSMGGEVTNDYAVRVAAPAMRQALVSAPGFAGLPEDVKRGILDHFEGAVKKDLPPITEDSMPGELSNVIAGRVANALDLSGPNFTVDAACASSMAAIQTAVKGLMDGDYDMAITGGADRSMSAATYTKFSKIGALSAEHSAPFDARANGFVMGEGAGVLVLKRLADAERDGDRIYAVIRGVGASSDGKGKGITAPNPVGQQLALQRAYAQAGFEPSDVDLIECHGTSTVVGDKVEVESLSAVIGEGRRAGRGPIRIGSVKSNIGHLKAAAGAASVMKVALSIFHGVFPPSINFQAARPDVPFQTVPLQVQTRPEPWLSAGPRRAGVSAFGFGGTNFHVVLEQAGTPALAAAAAPAPSTPTPVGIWAASAEDREELFALLQGPEPLAFDPSAPVRVAAAAASEAEVREQRERIIKTLARPQGADLLRSRNIFVEEEPVNSKLAFLFTGQGSQYIDMGLDLAERWPVVAQTFAEADEVLLPELGRPLSAFIRRDLALPEEEQFERLRATEISQPATLTVDVAILRLLSAYGVRPDMVAGHSLGEYAAAVAAGIMDFPDALRAVSARGREMASVQIDDKGAMAGIASSIEVIQEVLAEIPGYVVAANKNCPTQTVIAGETDAVGAAVEAFRSRGITVYPLPVSHAFHSRIVAPASVPLRRVLERLSIRGPLRPITTNVDSRYYPTGAGSREAAIDILARQVAAPVEWTAQIERMYKDGARLFVECGPKRALSGFVTAILKRRPHRALYTNHPKRGGVLSLLDCLASLTTLGFPVRSQPDDTSDFLAPPTLRLATTEAIQGRSDRLRAPAEAPTNPEMSASSEVVRAILDIAGELTGYGPGELRLEDELEADLGIDTVKQAELVARVRDHFKLEHDPQFRLADHRNLQDLANYAASRMGAMRIAAPLRRPAPQRPAVVQAVATPPAPVAPPPAAPPAPPAPVVAPVAAPTDPYSPTLGQDALRAMIEGAVRAGLSTGDAEAVGRAVAPALRSFLSELVLSLQPLRAAPPPTAPVPVVPSPPPAAAPRPRVVASGAAVGLPGGPEVFHPENIERVLGGENRISRLSAEAEQAFIDRHIVRLHKDARSGTGSFEPVSRPDQVIRLAGVKARFDLRDYGVDAEWIKALDITTQLAFAAGLEALRDAGIPLVRTWRETSKGTRVPTGWALPEPLRDRTGVVFASAFPGYTFLLEHLARNGADEQGHFDRRFLFQILAMGHSQFAQLIGARGPNTQVNAACASTTQAISIAEDWIRLGRCDRVVVVAADDVTNPTMLPWIGAGFIAAGAATTQDRVEEAALPFDRRRHGMILGMGAAGMVLERAELVAERGRRPLARLLASRLGNSAFHGTRLDPAHIQAEMEALVAEAVKEAGVGREAFAQDALFMSHETYTPAKGGSAAAEIQSLRHAFGPAARQILIANTKGFTGHAMGAGIEDAIALKAMQLGRVPPVPNLREPDPELGDLTLSAGGARQLRYAIRLAAGFGSQIALSAWEGLGRGPDLVEDAARQKAWLRQVCGLREPVLRVEERTLRAVEGALAAASAPSPAPAPRPAAAPPSVPAAPPAASPTQVQDVLLGIIAARTGYGRAELDLDYELEADLGIDTVKQAEIFGEVREHFRLPREDSFKLSDYPTIRALLGWVSTRVGASEGAAAASAAPTAPPPPAAAPVAPVEAPAPRPAGDVQSALLGVIARKTGYSPEELDLDYELEADLGIDTVKQAEIFGEVREHFQLPRDDSFKLSDYPTIRGLLGWLSARVQAATPAPLSAPSPQAERAPQALPAPQSAVAARPAGDVQAVLLGVVARKTGYSPEELDLDYELEADLGIDTVKQAEIFGEVREHFQLPRDDSFKLSDYPTIRGLLGWLSARVQAADPASSPALAPAPVAPAAGPAVDAVLPKLLEVVGRKTGYSPEELDLDYELEADLGIDTVKQAEIFGEVREHFQLPRDDSFKLSDYPTIRALAGWLCTRVAPLGVPQPDEAVDEAQPGPAVELESSTLRVADPPLLPPWSEGNEEITEESKSPPPLLLDEPGEELPPSFRLRRPILVPQPLVVSGDLQGRRVRIIGEGALSDALAVEVQLRGGQLSSAADEAAGLGPQLIIDASMDVEQAFLEARRVNSQPPARWICCTRLGADPAWVEPEAAFRAGAVAGLAKSLGREWAGCRASVVDLDPELPEDVAASMIIDEALCGVAMEVCRGGEQRSIIALQVEDWPAPRGRLGESPVIAITGGTRGVTARVALELARRGPCRMALLARTMPGEAPLDEVVARAEIKAELDAAGERSSPARIQARLDPLRAAEEARQTIASIQELGSIAWFIRVDTSDDGAVADAMTQVREVWGPIDGIIHGAGIEHSRLLSDKTLEDFRRIFTPKATGGMSLLRHLEPTAWFVSMGSVAGRFGNPGQTDYAAANEAMARVCLSRPRSLHVDWTAWAEVGMASRGGMARLLTDRGVEMLPPRAGAALLVDLLAAGVRGEVVVAGKLGEMEEKPIHPLIDELEIKAEQVLARRQLSVERDPWMLDHAIQGVAVLPGVMGLEMMLATSLPLSSGREWVGYQDVSFKAPLKLHRDEPVTVLLRAERRGEGQVWCQLCSERSSRTGRLLQTEHFEATLLFGARAPVDPLPSAFFAEEPIEQEEIYRRFFHGPRFQVLRRAEAVALDGLMAEAALRHADIAVGLISAPLVLEAAFQAAGLQRMAVEGLMALPSAIGLVQLERRPDDREALSLMVQRCEDGAFDIDVDGAEGPVMRVRGFRMIETGPLPGDRLFPTPEEGWQKVFMARYSSGPASNQEPPVMRIEELAALQRGTARRREQRLLGRLAARLALESGLGHGAFVVQSAPSGRPLVLLDQGGASPALTICHVGSEGLAAMVPAGRIGLDAERIEVRSPSFASSWLSPGERSLSSADPARETAIWTVKEAVLKALGQGMALPSGEVEVVELCGRRARVQLHGAALALHRAQGGGPVGASLSWEAGCVVATCLLRGAIAERVRTAA